VFLYLFAGHLLVPYDTAAGQVWLAVVAVVFFGAGVMLVRYSRLEVPERFTLMGGVESWCWWLTGIGSRPAGEHWSSPGDV
jgi:hypothetical protein